MSSSPSETNKSAQQQQLVEEPYWKTTAMFLPRLFGSGLRQFGSAVYGGISTQKAMEQAALAERKLLSKLAFFQQHTPTAAKSSDQSQESSKNETVKSELNLAGKVFAKIDEVRLSGPTGRYINTFMMDNDGDSRPLNELSPQERDRKKVLVLCHGFGAGIGLWFRNFPGLSTVAGLRVYAVDWLGMGRSSRTPLPEKHEDVDRDVDNVESYFCDSLDEWRAKVGIETPMYLLGHSFGGYINTAYALKYPQHVQKLILASPVGVPEERSDVEESMSKMSFAQRKLIGLFRDMWENGHTPQSFVRSSGRFGQYLLRQYALKRFPTVQGQDNDDMFDYILAISCMDGSGEFSINRILKPGAWARRPLGRKLHQLTMPTMFIYGQHDWMDSTVPRQLYVDNKLPEGSTVYTLENAGHQLFIDNPEGFNKAVLDFIDAVSAEEH